MSNNNEASPKKFGTIEFLWKDGGTPGVQFNKIAHSGSNELLMVSLVADTHRIKQIRAALVPDKGGKSKVTANAGGVKTKQLSEEDWYKRSPGRLNASGDGYYVHVHKLGFGLAHALLVSKTPGFLMTVSEESLWQQLNTTKFSTPLLREWAPFLERKLREICRLEDAHCYGCHCGILSATTSLLDELVVDGLTSGEIAILSSNAITKSESATLAVA